MERGLLWLPLLILFVGLAWAGWNEYQKIEAYRTWAQQFQRAKYDIRAVLGQREQQLVWGRPTRQGPVDLQTLALGQVQSVALVVDGQPVAVEAPPQRGRRIILELQLQAPAAGPVQIPFTEIPLAVAWTQYLQQFLAQ
jgi:hypothetical protein